ncbi:MAG: PxKF domain-containing protein, partial [Chloroflexia bacterium]|nr:PxKF domain-containing protein [Chloroflexia bacterium]
STEGANQSTTGTCTDVAGNTTPDTQTGINIDLTKPVVPVFIGITANDSFVFGSVPTAASISCESSDLLSGLNSAGCVVTGYSDLVSGTGQHTLTAKAIDVAGNEQTATLKYTVTAWTLNGFYKPVDMGMLNTVKSGSTVPLKFEVFAGTTTELTSTTVVKSFTTQQVSCQNFAQEIEAPIEVTTTGGTVLRYDGTGGQFIQNWQTPKGKAGSCYKVTMTTQDGSTIVADFLLK